MKKTLRIVLALAVVLTMTATSLIAVSAATDDGVAEDATTLADEATTAAEEENTTVAEEETTTAAEEETTTDADAIVSDSQTEADASNVETEAAVSEAETTAAVPVTTPKTGDNMIAVIALASIAVLGAAVVVAKKKN